MTTSVDWAAIGSNLAAKFGNVDGIVSASYPAPNELGLTPAIVLFPPSATLEEAPALDWYTSRWPATLYVERTSDFAPPLQAMDPLIGSIYDAFHDGKVLGLSGVVQNCRIVSHEIDHLPQYDGAYIGCRFEVEVQVIVPVARTA